MAYWVYNHEGLGKKVFYTEKDEMRVSDFVRAINNGGYGVHGVTTRMVGQSSTVPRANAGGRVYYISANTLRLVDGVEALCVEPGFLEKLTDRLVEAGITDQALDVLSKVAAEFGIELKKEHLEEAEKARADVESLGGAVIVYGNYFIVG